MASELTTAFEKLVSEKRVPGIGAVVVDKSGKQIYNEAFGTHNVINESAQAFTNDSELLIFSCTKLIVAICALQLVEQGKLSLDDPVSKYLPYIADIQVQQGFDSDGKPKSRPRETEMKIIHLLTHTSGITYDFWESNKFMYDYRARKNQPVGQMLAISAEWQFKDFLLEFDPGNRYEYGLNLDQIGLIVEKITGLQIQDYVTKYIAEPLQLKHMGPIFSTDEDKTRMAVHLKSPEGLTAVTAITPTKTPWRYGGGHFIITSLNDYTQVLLALLNDGTHPGTGAQILKPETVDKYLFQDMLPQVGCSSQGVGHITASIEPGASNAGDMLQHLNLPDEDRGWSCGFLVTKRDVPGYRTAGSGAWAGFTNLYYWVDKKAGKAGIVGTSILPFADQDVLGLFEKVEKFAYAN